MDEWKWINENGKGWMKIKEWKWNKRLEWNENERMKIKEWK